MSASHYEGRLPTGCAKHHCCWSEHQGLKPAEPTHRGPHLSIWEIDCHSGDAGFADLVRRSCCCADAADVTLVSRCYINNLV